MEIKYPLVSIDGHDAVCRVAASKTGREEMHKLLCHQQSRPCTARCNAISMARVKGVDVFICKSASRPIILGNVDFNHTPMEVIQTFEHGSDLQQNKEMTAEYKKGGCR